MKEKIFTKPEEFSNFLNLLAKNVKIAVGTVLISVPTENIVNSLPKGIFKIVYSENETDIMIGDIL